MFGTIRKHQTWLWAIIITLTIISFVIFFSPYSKLNDSRNVSGNFGSISGERISQDDYLRAWKEVCLRTFVMTGQWPDDKAKEQGGEVERETYQWLLLIQKQHKLGVHVSTDMIAQAAKAMLGQLERAKVIPSAEMFIKQVLPRYGYQVDDFERMVRHYMGVQELVSAVGVAGKLVTPEEIKELYKREHQERSADAMFFSASNYLSAVTAPPDAIEQFYTNRQAVYRIPERIQVNYVRFNPTNYAAEANQELASMTNLDLKIEQMYNQHGTNFLAQVNASSLEEAKKKVRENEQKRLELQIARRNAMDFAAPLFDMEPLRTDNLDKLAKEKGLAVQTTAPFDLQDGPKDLDVGQDFAQKAFGRTTNDPFAGPIVAPDGVYIIALEKKIPSEIPPLSQIREQVVRDYKFNQALNLARKAGMAFQQTLTNELAKGKTPATLAAAAGVKVVDLPPVSLSTRSLPEVEEQLPLNQLKQILFTTSVSNASPFQMTSQGGVVVYVKSTLPLDEAKMNADLTAFATAVRQRRQNEVFNDWFRQEAERGLRDTPLNRPQPPPAMSTAPKAGKS